jgi:FixJ family two-component response regulator
MCKPLTTRNEEIARAVLAGRQLKDVAFQFGISVPRVSQITQAVAAKPSPIVSKDEVARALDGVAAAINNLADAVRRYKGD